MGNLSNDMLIAKNSGQLPYGPSSFDKVISSRREAGGVSLLQGPEGKFVVTHPNASDGNVSHSIAGANKTRGQLIVIDVAENPPYAGGTLRQRISNDRSVKEVRLANHKGKTRLVIELNKGFAAQVEPGSVIHRFISIKKTGAVVPPKPDRHQTLAEKTLDRCVLTYDDGPHVNDIKIAEEALKTGAKVEFYWNTQNFLNAKGRKELNSIKAGESILDHFDSNPWKLKKFLRDNMAPEQQRIARRVASIAERSGGRIVIGSHSTFHPHSKNLKIGGIDQYTVGPGKTPKRIEYRSQLHPNSVDFAQRDKSGQTGWEDDLKCFEYTLSEALSTPGLKVRHVRLPGSNANMVQQLYKSFLKDRGAVYRDFTHDSYDSNQSKADDVKPRKAFRDTMNALKSNPGTERIYLWHSKSFDNGDITGMTK